MAVAGAMSATTATRVVHGVKAPCAAARVVVCVPTYRRPEQLARLLHALAGQRDVERFAILIGNNDTRDLTSWPPLTAADLPPYEAIDVRTRGVSAVRNAMIADVLDRAPAARWIACIDDDQIPADDWLAQLVSAGDRWDADLVGGPVARIPAARTYWSSPAADTSYLPRTPGPIATLNEAGNLLIATRFLRGLGREPFSVDFGRTGGEDYEFFLLAQARRARIAWEPAARVSEALEADRLTFRSFVWRFYSIAAYQARADRRYRGAWHVIRGIGIETAKAPLLAARALVKDRRPSSAIAILVRCVALVAGRLVGLAGVKAARYGDSAGGAAPRR